MAMDTFPKADGRQGTYDAEGFIRRVSESRNDLAIVAALQKKMWMVEK
jgi:hypothetical protein